MPVALQPQNITELWPALISRPAEGRRLSCPGWLDTYRGDLPVRRRSLIPELTATPNRHLSEYFLVVTVLALCWVFFHNVNVVVHITDRLLNLRSFRQ